MHTFSGGILALARALPAPAHADSEDEERACDDARDDAPGDATKVDTLAPAAPGRGPVAEGAAVDNSDVASGVYLRASGNRASS